MSTATPGERGPAHRARDTTRWDIQGLRAFAVLAVVVYHLWPGALHGGFVGVDVFFVISGFLITGLLLREQLATGTIRLGRFWSRRAKRLLPAAFLTIVVTGVAVLVAVPSALWGQYGRELIASTVYLQNWELAANAVDYLASADAPSPFQHFWSLSVEEQFYILLPLLLLGVGALARRRFTPLATARLLLGSVVVLSLVWSIVQTATDPGVAYFSTGTRAWEFALGGLVATVHLPEVRTEVARRVRLVATGIGVVALALSLVVITPETAFPGIAALLPVAGAALVLLFGAGTEFEDVGALRPVAFFGRISYALYLWHWPLVVILPIMLGRPLDWATSSAVLLVAIGLATVTTIWFEEPVRFSTWLRDLQPRGVVSLAVICSFTVVTLGAATLTAVYVQEVNATTVTKQVTAEQEDDDESCFGAAARIGFADPCVDPELADVRVPAPAVAKDDDDNRAECWSGTFRPCVLGKATGWSKHLIVIGDSHSNALLGAYEKIADDNGWRIDLAGAGGCYLTTAQQDSLSPSSMRGCNSWKHAAIDYVREHRDADALVVTHSTTQMPVSLPPGPARDKATRNGLVDAWEQAAGDELPVIAVRDNPVPRPDVVACLSTMSGPTTDACDRSRAEALGTTDSSVEAVAAFRAAGGRAASIDLSRYYCTDTTCPAVVGGVLVYRDSTHITATWASSLEPYLERALRDRLAAFAR
ncbi:acyltransferase family protein [Curtobacterium sp. MCLR17_031]|uniref:acyltransferase family protein n=1 Tax=Curtobacterium sp. MCLR17_031 TaxID=2175622 RepID=UPI000DA75761|nr:acyltransferase family protein [Curtobacterium sp. MCLR17_031]WIE57254.1 acyltransferase family protein [Curtobacterium sp. MCLR17_031]